MYRYWKLKICYLGLIFMSTLYITAKKKGNSETIISVRKGVRIITLMLLFYMLWSDISIVLYYDVQSFPL